MGHSAKYRIKQKADLQMKGYEEPEAKKPKAKGSTAWRKIEERELFKQFCHDLEFFDEHIDGNFEDYMN